MAENVAVTTLEVRGTEQVATSMKELKEQIKDYRDELVVLGQIEDKTEQQREEEVRVIEKLQKATKLLSDVTSAHKKELTQTDQKIDANIDSYNALQAQMTKLKKAYKDMSAAERESDFGRETLADISALDIKLKEIDADMGQFQRNVGNYGQTFEDSMNQARQNSGFLAQGIGTLTSTISLLGIQNEGLNKTIAALGIAFQAFTNEGLTKMIVKMKESITAKVAARKAAKAQAAESKAAAAAMQAEAAATQTATAATNGFKKALIGLGIGAIVVAVGALIANWDKLTAAFSRSKKAAEDAKKEVDRLVESLGRVETDIELNIRIMEAEGKDSDAVLKARLDAYNDLLKQTQDKMDAMYARGLGGSEAYNALLEQEQKYWDEIKAIHDERLIADIERRTAAKEEAARIAQERRDAEIKAAEDERNAVNAFLAAEAEDEARALAQEEAMFQAAADAEVATIMEKVEAQKAAVEEENAILMESLAVYEEINQKKKESDEELAQNKKDVMESYAGATTSILGSVADTLETLSGEEEKSAKAAKGMRIAQATIDTISGAIGAFTQAAESIPPPFGLAVGAANAATVTATGLANIAKIKATPIGAGAGTSAVSSLASGSIGASVPAPNIDTDLPATRNLTSASEEELLNRMASPSKVYILQSEIEAAGKMAKAQVTESSF